MGNITKFRGITKGHVPPDDVLKGAKGKLKQVLVIGIDHDDYYYFAGSTGDPGENLLMVEEFKMDLLEPEDDWKI